MEITWLGHSCIKIQSRGITLITDPYPASIGISMGKPNANIVTVSNEDTNHSYVNGITGNPKVLSGPGEYEIENYYISGLGTDRYEFEGDTRINTVFSYRVEGITLCHLGDIGKPLLPRDIERLRQSDILFVPVGGGCVAESSQIAQMARTISPRLVIPLHYQMDKIKVELSPLEDFLKAFEVNDPTPQNKLTATATNLPRDLEVAILSISSK